MVGCGRPKPVSGDPGVRDSGYGPNIPDICASSYTRALIQMPVNFTHQSMLMCDIHYLATKQHEFARESYYEN